MSDADLLRRAAELIRRGGAEATDDLIDIGEPLAAWLEGATAVLDDYPGVTNAAGSFRRVMADAGQPPTYRHAVAFVDGAVAVARALLGDERQATTAEAADPPATGACPSLRVATAAREACPCGGPAPCPAGRAKRPVIR